MHIGSQTADMIIALLLRFSDGRMPMLAGWKVLRLSALPTALKFPPPLSQLVVGVHQSAITIPIEQWHRVGNMGC